MGISIYSNMRYQYFDIVSVDPKHDSIYAIEGIKRVIQSEKFQEIISIIKNEKISCYMDNGKHFKNTVFIVSLGTMLLYYTEFINVEINFFGEYHGKGDWYHYNYSNILVIDILEM